MRNTNRETSTTTLARLLAASESNFPVTVTYLKEEKDEAGKKTGHLIETVRTIEIYDTRTTKAGDITLKAMDRETGESRTFRLDRIRSYTVHRTAYTVARPTTDEPTVVIPVASSAATIVGRELARDDAAYYADRYAVLAAA